MALAKHSTGGQSGLEVTKRGRTVASGDSAQSRKEWKTHQPREHTNGDSLAHLVDKGIFGLKMKVGLRVGGGNSHRPPGSTVPRGTFFLSRFRPLNGR